MAAAARAAAVNEAVQVTETFASRLTGEQALVVIVCLPFLMAAFVVFWLMRKRLGFDDGPAGSKDVVDRTNVLLAGMQQELARSQALLQRYAGELEQLRNARIGLFIYAQQFLDAAIAGRTMVHEMERKAGLPETAFPALPSLADLLTPSPNVPSGTA